VQLKSGLLLSIGAALTICSLSMSAAPLRPGQISVPNYTSLTRYIEANAGGVQDGDELYWSNQDGSGYVRFRKKYARSGDDPTEACGPCEDPCRSITMTYNSDAGTGRLVGNVCLSPRTNTWQLEQIQVADWRAAPRIETRMAATDTQPIVVSPPSPQPSAPIAEPDPASVEISPPPASSDVLMADLPARSIADMVKLLYTEEIYGTKVAALSAFLRDESLSPETATVSIISRRLSENVDRSETTGCTDIAQSSRGFLACTIYLADRSEPGGVSSQ